MSNEKEGGTPKPKAQPNVAKSKTSEERATALEELKIEQEQKQKLLDALLENADNYKKYTDYEAPREHLDVLRRTVCAQLNTAEFYFYLQVCHQLKLDPYLKQVWCYIDNKDKLVIIVGRDGFLAHCEKQPDFKGLLSAPIYANDTVQQDYANGVIQHTSPGIKDRGELIGAWAICYRENRIPRLMVVSLDEYKKENNNYSPWKSNPSAMIMKVAELEAMRKQFPMSGVQNEHDWDVLDSGKVQPHDKSKAASTGPSSELIKLQKYLIDRLDETSYPDKENLRKTATELRRKNELDINNVQAMLDILHDWDDSTAAKIADLKNEEE